MSNSVSTTGEVARENLPAEVRRIKVQRGQPQELEKGDRIGDYLNFLGYVEGDGYHFYQTCGLQECSLHWTTVNWLLESHDVTRVNFPPSTSSETSRPKENS